MKTKKFKEWFCYNADREECNPEDIGYTRIDYTDNEEDIGYSSNNQFKLTYEPYEDIYWIYRYNPEYDSWTKIDYTTGKDNYLSTLISKYNIIKECKSLTEDQTFSYGKDHIGEFNDYHIDTKGMGILEVENRIKYITDRGYTAMITVNTSDGETYHTSFDLKSWKEFKDAVNDSGRSITDVWITEVK